MRTAGLLALAIFFPAFVHAAVVIDEIMYDPKGADASSGGEWIEVQNTGSTAVDFTKWVFFENNTNHGITADSSSEIPPNGYAVISSDAAVFKNYFTNFQGALFKASFSLGDGEKLTMKNGKDDMVTDANSVTYTSDWGAKNDGNSLQLVDGNWITAVPTPSEVNEGTSSGIEDSSTTASNSVPEESFSTQSSSSGSTAATRPPPSALTVDAGTDRSAVMEVPLHLFARAMVKGGAVDPNAQVLWGFGDGSSAEGSTVEKTYRYAGAYLVVVTATDGHAAAGRDEFIVTVRPAQVRILEIPDMGIVVTNDTNERLDLSEWALFADKGSFRIPNGTVLLPKANVLFSSTITKLPMAPEVTLAYPSGGIAARYAVSTEPIAITTSASAPDAQPPSRIASYEQVQKVEPIISVKENVPEYAEAVGAPAVANELAAAGAVLSPPTLSVGAPTSDVGATPASRFSGIFKSPWALGFLGVVVLAGSAFIFL